jgi:hypothetical protein
LEIRKRVSGAKHGDTLRVMNELATAHKRVGDFPRATRLDLERRRLGKAVDELTCTDAAQGGHLEVLQWARANGCPWDETLVNIAAQNGHEAVVRALIELGADVNKAHDIGWTALYAAAYNGHEAVVRALIEADTDVNKAHDIGWTPLYAAACKGHETGLRALKEAGADVNQAEDNGVTPLFIAAQRGGGAGADRGGRGRQQGKE